MTTRLEFYDLCAAHDWHYSMADDHSEYRKGEKEAIKIATILDDNPDYADIHKAWLDHVERRAPKPPRDQVMLDDSLCQIAKMFDRFGVPYV